MGFQKNEYFFGYEEIVDIAKLDYLLCVCRGGGGGGGGISIHFKDFLKVMVQNWIFFFGIAIIFLGGMAKFLIFFRVNSTFVDAGS